MKLIQQGLNLLKKDGNLFGQMVRYIISGGVASLVDIGIMIFLTEYFSMREAIAASIGNIVGLVITYLLSIFWIFDERRLKKPIPEFLIFAAIGIGATLLTFLLMSVFVDHLQIHYILAKIITIVLVSAYSFLIKKLVLFRK